jgi:hypothetical protein
MRINGRTGDIWNRWTDLSGIRVRGRDMVGESKSLIGCSILIQSLCSIVLLERNFIGGVWVRVCYFLQHGFISFHSCI